MRFFSKAQDKFLPSFKNLLLTILSAILLVLSFPDFEVWFLAWVALVPLFWAIEREKRSAAKSFFLGWLWGTSFFFGTCWWLAYAPTHYGGIPAPVSYFLVFCACALVGIFPAIFALAFSLLLKRFGVIALLSAPFLWTTAEFLRFWTTGNNWNAVGYSQAFSGGGASKYASVGGVYIVGFALVCISAVAVFLPYLYSTKALSKKDFFLFGIFRATKNQETTAEQRGYWVIGFVLTLLIPFLIGSLLTRNYKPTNPFAASPSVFIVAVQPNVPMSGLQYEQWQQLRQKHVELAANALETNLDKFVEAQTKLYSKPETLEKDEDFYDGFVKKQFSEKPKIVIFPESPMNFMYERDREFQQFAHDFTTRNNTSVLFNSAEPDKSGESYFNSAVMVNEKGEKIAQYDKIFLLPFGEYAPVPAPLQRFVPTMVGNFSFGTEYDLLPFGEAKAGVMICFESHFPNLSREYVRQSADFLVEMTNDGYLGNTPVLRQHLASAVFRAIETNRPVLRVTNVGVTAFINERGEILDAAEPYTEATRVWAISKSDGEQTLYVKYGDWFAWLCSIASLVLLSLSFRKSKGILAAKSSKLSRR